jgi:uncharacterized protein DUF3857/transglutaminase superfamily protein
MKTKQCSRPWRRLRRTSLSLSLAAAALLAAAPTARAGAPDWLRALAQEPLREYPNDVAAVALLDEQTTTVKDNGEVETRYRAAYRILRPEGREHGVVAVYFDQEARLTWLKGWCIPGQGQEYEVKEKDAVETGITLDTLYQDTRYKILKIPAAEPGNVVGYEYVKKGRHFILQDTWWFQDEIPLRHGRYTLQLPAGWEFTSFWSNYPAQQPREAGQHEWVWEVENVPAVVREPGMPPWHAVAGRLAVMFFSKDPGQRSKSAASWSDVGLWYASLTAESRQPTPEIKQKVAELTASARSQADKIRALCSFLQREVRYVEIKIGIGGFQPHPASSVFASRYGDCKDKATLLSTMLKEINIESFYVLIHTERGVLLPKFSSPLSFNHAILAIHLPAGVPTEAFYAAIDHPKWGKLLFFDPTDPFTPLGYLPTSLQDNYGLLVTGEGGELVKLPLLPPTVNRLLRVGKLSLSPTGTLSGDVQEIRWGAPAVSSRAEFLHANSAGRRKILENFLGQSLAGFVLTGGQILNLEKYDESLVLNYNFVAENYAKTAGNLLLVRPRVLGEKSQNLEESKPRKYSVEFPMATLETDQFEIALPPGYVVDELPSPVKVEFPFGEYRSQLEASGNTLRYQRTYEIKGVEVPAQHLDELKIFFRQISADERSTAVLRRASP